MERLGRISDGQICDALRASGATLDEIECYRAAIRARLDRLQEIAGGSLTSSLKHAGGAGLRPVAR